MNEKSIDNVENLLNMQFLSLTVLFFIVASIGEAKNHTEDIRNPRHTSTGETKNQTQAVRNRRHGDFRSSSSSEEPEVIEVIPVPVNGPVVVNADGTVPEVIRNRRDASTGESKNHTHAVRNRRHGDFSSSSSSEDPEVIEVVPVGVNAPILVNPDGSIPQIETIRNRRDASLVESKNQTETVRNRRHGDFSSSSVSEDDREPEVIEVVPVPVNGPVLVNPDGTVPQIETIRNRRDASLGESKNHTETIRTPRDALSNGGAKNHTHAIRNRRHGDFSSSSSSEEPEVIEVVPVNVNGPVVVNADGTVPQVIRNRRDASLGESKNHTETIRTPRDALSNGGAKNHTHAIRNRRHGDFSSSSSSEEPEVIEVIPVNANAPVLVNPDGTVPQIETIRNRRDASSGHSKNHTHDVRNRRHGDYSSSSSLSSEEPDVLPASAPVLANGPNYSQSGYEQAQQKDHERSNYGGKGEGH